MTNSEVEVGNTYLLATLTRKTGGDYDLETQQFFISRDVVFYENKFPFASSSTTPSHIGPMIYGGEDGT